MFLTTTRRSQPDLFTSLHRLMNFTPGTSAWLPPVDVKDTKDGLSITLEVPGVKPEDLKISVENQVLTIRGEKKNVSEETDARWHRFERTFGSFERSFTLPTSVDSDRIEARVTDGVLTLTLPRAEKAKLKEIAVK